MQATYPRRRVAYQPALPVSQSLQQEEKDWQQERQGGRQAEHYPVLIGRIGVAEVAFSFTILHVLVQYSAIQHKQRNKG